MAKKELQHIDLKSIQNPEFLKGMSYPELDLLSEDIRKYIIDVTSKNGGHLDSYLGATDLIVAIHRYFDLPPLSRFLHYGY